MLGEIRYGVERLRRRGDDRQAAILERWLDRLKTDFAERVLGISTAIAERWALLNAERPLGAIDGLIVATAIERDLTLVTRNRRSVAGTGVRLLDPWS